MKHGFLHLISAILLIFPGFHFQMAATEYYVSSTGNDNNDGKTKATAWATISRVNMTSFAPGDRILFEAGKTFHGNLLLDEKDAGLATNPLILGTYFSFDGTDLGGNGCAIIHGGDGNGIKISGSTGVTVRQLMISGSGRNINYRGNGILLDAARDIFIDKVETEGFQMAGIMIYGGSERVKVTNVYSHDNGYTGIGVGYRGDGLNKNIYIGYCRTIHNPGISEPSKYIGDQSGSGINLGNVEGGLVEYCESADNGGDFYHEGGNGPVGIWLYNCKDVTIQYCISHDNKSQRMVDGHLYADGGGFDFDSGTKNCFIQYCYSYHNAGPGYLLCAWDTVESHVLENNTLRYSISDHDAQKSGAGIWIWHSMAQRNMQIYNNIFYNSSGRSCIKAIDVKGTFFFRNNIFVLRGTGSFVEGMEPNAVFQGNCYWNYNNAGSWDGATNFESWRARGQETLDNKPVGINQDPLLVFSNNTEKLTDPTKILELNEFKLLSGSPCIDAGINLSKSLNISAGDHDFFGNKSPQNKSSDIGIHENPEQHR
jgi:hypothetical protein